jgi:hypothetical protein
MAVVRSVAGTVAGLVVRATTQEADSVREVYVALTGRPV